jgi:hypothetical protein
VTSAHDDFAELMRSGFIARDSAPDEDSGIAPLEVPQELKDRVLRRVSRQSGRTLARRLVRAAERRGYSVDALVADSGTSGKSLRRFLSEGRDPWRVPSGVMARVMWLSGLDPMRWHALLRQACVSSAPPSALEAPIWGRTAGLSKAERQAALTRHGSEPTSTDQIQHDADQYLAEVLQAWTTLRAGENNP